ncbi:MAG TPA: putative glycoside hydrolase [Chthonomonadaceae bacterium]|nr:putative glycoside hydrolase [Chthonomonadaceae bacterium]
MAQPIRPECPVRLGGVYTEGLGDSPGARLSADNQRWILQSCDVIALDSNRITPTTFPAMVKAYPLFTPLLYVYASSVYEQPDHKGNVGGWKPEMSAWTLRDEQNKEIPYPDAGGHWMDFGNTQWAAFWRDRVLDLTRRDGAFGVVAAELPPGNTFVGDHLANYKDFNDRAAATGRWLQAAHAPGKFLLIPSAIGFDSPAGHATLATPPSAEEPELRGTLWDDYYSWIDGAWAEGWIHPYWSDTPLPPTYWEIEEEAADRAARNGQVFIAAAAYRNDAELEYDLASYLLITHHQGRLVFQPMPLLPAQPPDAGFSLAVLRREVAAKSGYFNAPLGVALQERHIVQVTDGVVWRRTFQNGVVYVNADIQQKVTIQLGGTMKRPNGDLIQDIVLPPQSGAILLYTN